MYWLNSIGLIFKIFDRLILATFFAFIILEQNYSKNSFFKVSSFKTVSKLGLYTYSLYMTHFLCVYVVNKVLDILKLNTHIYQVVIVQTIISFIASLLVAWLSYTYIEKTFLSLKKRFNSKNIKSEIEAKTL
jgi:peptidoglycan/LPS O-acetylase OafA/YrhL